MNKNKQAFILLKQMIVDLDEKVDINNAKIESLKNKDNEKISSLIYKIHKLEENLNILEESCSCKKKIYNKNLKINKK